jgi:hypothetical protein
VNPATHVSAPRALWPPLRTVIEEAWQTFFTGGARHAVKCSQQPVCADLGPRGIQSCQCQVIPIGDGVTARRSSASSLMSLPVRLFSFNQEEKSFSGLHLFEVCIIRARRFFSGGVLWDFRPLCVIQAQGSFFEVFCLLFETFE